MEAVAMITAFIYIKKWQSTYWKWFPYYLTFIVIAEIIGNTLGVKNMAIINLIFYSYVVIPIEFFFFFWIFYQDFKITKSRWLPILCICIYALSLLTDIIYFRNVKFTAFSFSYTIGNILLLLLIINFFLRLVNSDNLLKFRQNILFWVSVGLLIYYLGSCPFYGLKNLLANKYFNSIYVYYSVFVYILDSLMYLTFALSFICGKPNS